MQLIPSRNLVLYVLLVHSAMRLAIEAYDIGTNEVEFTIGIGTNDIRIGNIVGYRFAIGCQS